MNVISVLPKLPVGGTCVEPPPSEALDLLRRIAHKQAMGLGMFTFRECLTFKDISIYFVRIKSINAARGVAQTSEGSSTHAPPTESFGRTETMLVNLYRP